MGWQDRQYGSTDGGGRFGGAVRRIFGDGENPLNWALPLYTLWGITVKVHIFYVVYIIIQLIRSIPHTELGLVYASIWMGTLFVLVLLHEYGHCIACRRVEGDADRILMWPLGGLAYCMPPHNWRAHLITALGGPMVNVILWPVLGAMLWLATGSWSSIIFNPFDAAHVLSLLNTRSGVQPLWLVILWYFYFMNAALLAFNMLLPMYPMDAGRVLQTLIWRSTSYARSMRIATLSGMIVAGFLAVFAITLRGEGTLLLAIAIFGGITCWLERRRIAFETAGSIEGYDFSRGYAGMPDAHSPRAGRAAERRRKREAKEAAELERILDKIKTSGMGRLSGREKRFLERESQRRRDD
jgi:stage IV sporulation protein FB